MKPAIENEFVAVWKFKDPKTGVPQVIEYYFAPKEFVGSPDPRTTENFYFDGESEKYAEELEFTLTDGSRPWGAG